jgi:hypothetical protein
LRLGDSDDLFFDRFARGLLRGGVAAHRDYATAYD